MLSNTNKTDKIDEHENDNKKLYNYGSILVIYGLMHRR